MTAAAAALAPATAAWVERCLAARARVASAVRLGGPTGPWLLRVRRVADEFPVILRAGDPQSVNERRRFGVESAALQTADQFGVAAPRLIACDLTGHDASQLTVLSTYLHGANTIPTTASRQRLVALGRAVASLSSASPNNDDLPVRQRPLSDLEFGAARDCGASTPLLDEADRFLTAAAVPDAPNVLVHVDCWQGNTMWDRDVFTGFVDWDAAGVGLPGLDLGSIRFDAALYYGVAGLDHITQGWTDGGGPEIHNLAYWDVIAALAAPTDLTPWMPIITAPRRNDLDIHTVTSRRDDFVTAALHRANR
jgi:aminoglycoside phosphotransferase (APT) family kinase protein